VGRALRAGDPGHHLGRHLFGRVHADRSRRIIIKHDGFTFDVPIIAFALPLAQAFAALNVPQAVLQQITELTTSPTLIILLMLAVLIVAGCVMETTPNIVVLAPIMLPIAQEIGMDQIQFCIFMVTALGVGFITPPLGLNLFVLSGLAGEKILPIAGKAIPYVLSMLVVVLMLAFIPWLSLWALH
jgi:TRAP-type C4-dicarboxylate transport system permease large subunit